MHGYGMYVIAVGGNARLIYRRGMMYMRQTMPNDELAIERRAPTIGDRYVERRVNAPAMGDRTQCAKYDWRYKRYAPSIHWREAIERGKNKEGYQGIKIKLG